MALSPIIDQTRPDQTRPDHYSAFYSDKFYKGHHSDLSITSARKIVSVLKQYINFESVIDIGCGVGQNLMACYESGAKIIRGVDGSWVNKDLLMLPKECFTQYDLSQPNIKAAIPEQHFDLTISSEVAEHIDKKDTDTYMDNLTSFSDVILFSAAIPGQGGTHHVNEQWPSYWIEKFAARGYVPVDCIRFKLWYDKEVQLWYRQNLMIFVKENALDEYPELKREAEKPVIDVVHFGIWDNVHRATKRGFKANCRMILSGLSDIIPSFFRAVKNRI